MDQTSRGWIERSSRILPFALGILLLSTNRWLTEVDDECAIIDRAAQPVSQTVALYVHGVGEHEHPPLYDILLHGWLRLTGGNLHLLRVPSILFYVLGTWTLAKAAKELGGIRSQWWVLVILTLWPFGYHFGRLATWYPFSFLLVCLLTLSYVKFLAEPTVKRWLPVSACSLALVYSNYFGWVFLAFLALDYVIRNFENRARIIGWLLPTGVILFVAYVPILPAFRSEATFGTRSDIFSLSMLANEFYNIYCIFVSESVAPWFWFLGIPAAIAIVICLVVTFVSAPSPARAFLIYFLCLVTFLAALGIVIPKRILFMGPWLILPIGVALGTLSNQAPRRVLVAALAFIAAVGWFGIFSRNLYAAPHWVEPWQSVAQRAAQVAHDRGIVIGNNPSFFFYLTDLLPVEPPNSQNSGFHGLLPDSVRATGVYTPQQWIESGRPVGPEILFARGLHYGSSADLTEQTQQWLDSHCILGNSEQMAHDPGSELKQRYAAISQPEWRIEVRTYACK